MTPRIGIDLGGTKIEGVLLGTGDEEHRPRRDTPASEGYGAIVDAVAAVALELEARAGVPCSIGVGAPGAIDRRTGLIKNSNTQCLNGQALAADLTTALSREVRVANDANCFTLSEALDGAGQGHDVVFGVIIGTGVGGGIVVGNRVLDGPNGITGEWGHNTLEEDGPPCYCGRRGCVETLLSGPGLARDYHQAGGDPSLDGPAIVTASEAGEPHAVAALDRYVDRLGKGLASVINVLDPDVIVLGGGLSGIERLYRDTPAAVARYLFNGEVCTPIVRNSHGDSSGVLGAAMLW